MNETVTPNCRQKCSGCGAHEYLEEVSALKVRIKFPKIWSDEIYRTSGYYALFPEGNAEGRY